MIDSSASSCILQRATCISSRHLRYSSSRWRDSSSRWRDSSSCWRDSSAISTRSVRDTSALVSRAPFRSPKSEIQSVPKIPTCTLANNMPHAIKNLAATDSSPIHFHTLSSFSRWMRIVSHRLPALPWREEGMVANISVSSGSAKPMMPPQRVKSSEPSLLSQTPHSPPRPDVASLDLRDPQVTREPRFRLIKTRAFHPADPSRDDPEIATSRHPQDAKGKS